MKLSFDIANEIRDNYNPNMESKNSYCSRTSKKYAISESMVKQILNNKKWYNPDYKPTLTGNKKLSQLDIDIIRKSFQERLDDISVSEFIDIYSNRNNVSKTQIANIIYNRTWVDKDYTPLKAFEPKIKVYNINNG